MATNAADRQYDIEVKGQGSNKLKKMVYGSSHSLFLHILTRMFIFDTMVVYGE